MAQWIGVISLLLVRRLLLQLLPIGKRALGSIHHLRYRNEGNGFVLYDFDGGDGQQPLFPSSTQPGESTYTSSIITNMVKCLEDTGDIQQRLEKHVSIDCLIASTLYSNNPGRKHNIITTALCQRPPSSSSSFYAS